MARSNASEIQYATCDGLAVGYQTSGDGDLDLVLLPGAAHHIEFMRLLSEYSSFLDRLGAFARLTVFDKRGTGVSDPIVGVPTLDERVDELVAVIDAIGAERVALLGLSEGGPAAALFAATYPERCSHLILHGAVVNGATLTPGWLERFQELWGTGRAQEVFGERERQRLDAAPASMLAGAATFERVSASPSMFRAVIDAVRQIDVVPILPTVNVPTLVLHRVGDPIPVEQGRLAASAIPDARLVELDGDQHHPWMGDVDAVVGEIEQFLVGRRSTPVSDRVLAVLLFTDVVGSTEHVAAVGDAAWSELLDRWEERVRSQIEQHRGREVFTKGDEFFVAFDGPARAVQCAVALRETATELGLSVRTGLHAGECQVRDDDLAGVAVHTAARVMAEAAPDQILATSTVRDLAAGSRMTFADHATVELRGVPGTWTLCEVTPSGEAPVEHPPALTLADRVQASFVRRAPRVARKAFRRGERYLDRRIEKQRSQS